MKLLCVLILMVFVPWDNLQAKKVCKCGSHASGITEFWVDDGQPCCGGFYTEGTPYATVRTYALGSDGVWYQTSITDVSFASAQTGCCQ